MSSPNKIFKVQILETSSSLASLWVVASLQTANQGSHGALFWAMHMCQAHALCSKRGLHTREQVTKVNFCLLL